MPFICLPIVPWFENALSLSLSLSLSHSHSHSHPHTHTQLSLSCVSLATFRDQGRARGRGLGENGLLAGILLLQRCQFFVDSFFVMMLTLRVSSVMSRETKTQK